MKKASFAAGTEAKLPAMVMRVLPVEVPLELSWSRMSVIVHEPCMLGPVEPKSVWPMAVE